MCCLCYQSDNDTIYQSMPCTFSACLTTYCPCGEVSNHILPMWSGVQPYVVQIDAVHMIRASQYISPHIAHVVRVHHGMLYQFMHAIHMVGMYCPCGQSVTMSCPCGQSVTMSCSCGQSVTMSCSCGQSVSRCVVSI